MNACHERLRSLHHLLGRHVFDVVAQIPPIAKRITDDARALAPELILRLAERLSACGHGSGKGCVRVVHIDGEDARGHAALGDRPGMPHRRFIRHEHVRVADHELRVRHAAIRRGHAEEFHRTEGGLVEVQRISSALEGERNGDGGFSGGVHDEGG
jgi:hypothetical protein